jgi:hypothetical protein
MVPAAFSIRLGCGEPLKSRQLSPALGAVAVTFAEERSASRQAALTEKSCCSSRRGLGPMGKPSHAVCDVSRNYEADFIYSNIISVAREAVAARCCATSRGNQDNCLYTYRLTMKRWGV